MILTRISTRDFARHTKVDVDLPRTGIVVVTGKNGHGKSSLVEAVAQCGWNETLRGAPGWRKGAKSGVELVFEDGYVRRSVSDSKHALKWSADEDGAAEYATRTKSQTALESHIGSFHVWKHACTFHTDDVARFTGATDAERKRLLEEVLELDRVEQGYRLARNVLADEKRKLTEYQHAHALARQKCDALTRQLALLDGELEDEADVQALRLLSRELRDAVADLEDKVRHARETAGALALDKSTAQQALRQVEQRAARFEALGPSCPQCEQAVDKAHLQAHLDELVGQARELARELETLVGAHSQATAAVAEHERELAKAQAAYQECVQQGKAAVSAAERNEARRGKLAALEAEHAHEAELEVTLRERVQAQEVHVKELSAAVDVLSFQGVRAALLDGAVKALQDLACDWLGRLGLGQLSVELSSQSQSKAGLVSDKISFDVKGAGGGYGYKGCSTGERRRIDIAMMLAIGELAADSRGVSPGSTLFIDEVFDGLDAEGRDAAVDMLNMISRQRCVVVITHNLELTARLNAAVWLRAVDGDLKPDDRSE